MTLETQNGMSDTFELYIPLESETLAETNGIYNTIMAESVAFHILLSGVDNKLSHHFNPKAVETGLNFFNPIVKVCILLPCINVWIC